jgi:hypothetical protein
MQVGNLKNPADRNKLVAAGVLLVVAVFIWWTFIGFGGGGTAKVTPGTRPAAQPTPAAPRATAGKPLPQAPVELTPDDLDKLQPINANFMPVGAQDARRNIFVYYEPPKPTPKPSIIPTPTPTPVPPVLLARVSPANVYARTGDFTLEVEGDKFTPQLRVLVDSMELPTRYINPQQMSATVPAAVIASPGSRQIMLRSPDGVLYSNTVTLSIADPPKPNYTYIGIFGTKKRIGDTAILLDKGSKETLNVQNGDLVGGRFRVTSISEKEVVFVDSTLKIKHSLPMTIQGDRSNPMQRPTPRVESEDDEP